MRLEPGDDIIVAGFRSQVIKRTEGEVDRVDLMFFRGGWVDEERGCHLSIEKVRRVAVDRFGRPCGLRDEAGRMGGPGGVVSVRE